jgi:hypothetical protein
MNLFQASVVGIFCIGCSPQKISQYDSIVITCILKYIKMYGVSIFLNRYDKKINKLMDAAMMFPSQFYQHPGKGHAGSY